MRRYLEHALNTRAEEIAAGSFLDCHTRGLHSLLLCDKPGQIVRLFVATPEHDMVRNLNAAAGPLSIAYHSHDSDLTLHVVSGQIANVIAEVGVPGAAVEAFHYRSQIRDGSGGFDRMDIRTTVATRINWMAEGDAVFMPAHQYHTVAVMHGRRAAWFVYEGAKLTGFDAVAYSNDDLTRFDPRGLYRRPTVSQVRALLAEVGV